VVGLGDRGDALVRVAGPGRERIVDLDPAIERDRVGGGRAGVLHRLGEVEAASERRGPCGWCSR